jgi:Phosphotransferase enzyme family
MSGAPADSELIEALGGRVDGRAITSLERRPYRYATSAPLEEVRVATDGGPEVGMILKDLDRERLLGDARASKPAALYEPLREIEAYRSIIGPAGVGPRCFAAVAEPGRHWLLIEKVQGVELWQIGDFGVWERAAGWLGGLHGRFAGREEELRRASPHLLDHTREWYEGWRDRALAAVAAGGDERAPALTAALGGYGDVATALAASPRTLLHGEMYPANVLVVGDADPVGIYPVDWEMTATGPGAIDLAALSGGWEEDERNRLATAYCEGVAAADGTAPDPAFLAGELTRARLHLALQWLGWAPGWRPPPEHAQDWLGEALEVAGRLGLS